jgi:hypothetical protein
MAPCRGGFTFVVDPNPTPAEASVLAHLASSERSRRVIDRRLAHELGHTFFYGLDGRRLVSSSSAEEAFCDEFAEAFIDSRATPMAA